MSYTIESSDSPAPDDRDWSPFRTELPLNLEQAIALCRTVADVPGGQASWRVVAPDGRYVIRLSGWPHV